MLDQSVWHKLQKKSAHKFEKYFLDWKSSTLYVKNILNVKDINFSCQQKILGGPQQSPNQINSSHNF